MAENQKISKERGLNIDQIAMCCISMDSSQQALQTNEKLFFKFQISFLNFAKKQKIFRKISKRDY